MANQNRKSDGTQLKQLNEEQYLAVVNILFSIKPYLPYLLIGPPGKLNMHFIIAFRSFSNVLFLLF